MVLGSFWDGLGGRFGMVWGVLWMVLGSFRARFGITVAGHTAGNVVGSGAWNAVGSGAGRGFGNGVL